MNETLIEKAKKIHAEFGSLSTSILQRRLKISYAQAVQIMLILGLAIRTKTTKAPYVLLSST